MRSAIPTLAAATAALAAPAFAAPFGPNLLHRPAQDPALPKETSRALTDLTAEQQAPAVELAAKFQERRDRVAAWRLAHGADAAFAEEAGMVLRDVVGGHPIFDSINNENAAISSNTQLVRSQEAFGSPAGAGFTIGVWEPGGGNWNGHADWGAQFTFADSANGVARSAFHATHVVGTLIAQGGDPLALGMAPSASVDLYNSTNDTDEMLTAGAGSSFGFQNGSILLSNHSYGTAVGWHTSNGSTTWNGPWPGAEDPKFGQYNADAAEWDDVCWRRPYFLPFKSAGNDRSNGPPAAGGAFSYNDGTGWQTANFNAQIHPPSDASFDGGYDTLPTYGNAKNIMTVGAVEDAVLDLTGNTGLFAGGKSRWIFNLQTTTFSSWGPSDDGRIKPDIVANGRDLYSTMNQWPNNNRVDTYGNLSGTSMASPTACGSAVLLQELFLERFAVPGNPMRAATLKGLIIHTADDVGNAGPDYQFGWGLMNTLAAAEQIERHYQEPDNDHLYEGVQGAAAQTFTFYWDEMSPEIRATLCYTDRAGTAKTGLDNAARALVNDLDIEIEGPGGITYRPFVMDPANPANLATTGDNDVDNVEQILIEAPAPGLYTLTLSAEGAITGGVQQFSLILSGNSASDPAAVPQLVRLDQPFTEPFDTLPYAAQGWKYESTNAGRITHTGTAIQMDDASSTTADYALNMATLHLDLAGQSNVQLWVWWTDHSDEDHSLPAGNFTGTPDGDGVAISPDGVTWRKVADLHDDGLLGLSIIDLDPIVAAAGFSYNSDFRVRISQYDNASHPTDGISLNAVNAYIKSPGQLRMELAEASVEEGDTIDLNVMRENGVDGTVTCRYSTIADTAAGHYPITTGELTFGPGQTEKTISVPTIENASLDGTRRFRMRIYNPGGGATIGSPNETEITIIDDDRVAELAVSPAHLRPTALAGTDAPPQTLAIINGGGAKLNYEVSASPSWIVANATSGVLGGASELLTISYKTRFRPPGRYRGTVTVTDLDGNLPTVEIPVTLTLGYPGESYTAEFNSDTDLPAGPGEAVASRYPLTFSLPPLDGRVSNSLLIFSALEHGQPADLDAALVPPGGGAGVLAMSDCLKNATDPMKFAIADGGAPLPSAGPADFAAYAPTNYGSGNDGFKFPGPEGPQLARMADLNGIASEGGWNLYLMDDNDLGGSGVLTGAALRIETVALDDGIVEIFDAGHPFDLPRHSFLYTPSDTAGGYDIFHCQLSGLPAPVGGDKIEPAPDGYVPYALKNDEVIFFYGQKYGVVWIGEDGTIAFVDPAGAAGAPGLATHLALPRISGFFADLKLADGNIWAQQLGDRLVVTWNNVEDAATGEDVTFQIEIFFDDRIRITYAAIGKTAPLVGLSRGWGESFAARQIDFSAIQNTGLMIRGHDLNPGAMSSLIWTSQPNLLYEIQWTDSFKTWKRVKTVPGGSGATTESSFLDSGGRAGFYRVFKTGTVE